LPRTVQDAIIDEVFRAVGRVFDSPEELADEMVRNPDVLAIVADAVNNRSSKPNAVLSALPKADRGKIPLKMVNALSKRWERKNDQLDQSFSKPLQGDDDATLMAIDAIKSIMLTFNVRGETSVKKLHETLRLFVSMKGDDVNKALSYIESIR
jgi:hypothetical protein